MASTIPGGAYLDDQGRPQDANGERLDPLPERLSDEAEEACREVGIVSEKQVEFYSLEDLLQMGFSEKLALEVSQEVAEGYVPLADIEFASGAAEELAVDAGLTAEDFSGAEPSGETGYTKPDVEELTE
jgi:hypothetical protein